MFKDLTNKPKTFSDILNNGKSGEIYNSVEN